MEVSDIFMVGGSSIASIYQVGECGSIQGVIYVICFLQLSLEWFLNR